MSVMEDSRKVMQDFLAPEIRGINARLDALEKRFEEAQKRQEKFEDRVERRFDEAERAAGRRQETLLLSINSLVN